MNPNSAPLNPKLCYQLPDFYTFDNAVFRLFIFNGATEADVRKMAEEVETRKDIEQIDVYCEGELTEETLQSYVDIFDEAVSADRDLQIDIETHLSNKRIYALFATTRRQIVYGRALLN